MLPLSGMSDKNSSGSASEASRSHRARVRGYPVTGQCTEARTERVNGLLQQRQVKRVVGGGGVLDRLPALIHQRLNAAVETRLRAQSAAAAAFSGAWTWQRTSPCAPPSSQPHLLNLRGERFLLTQ